jgi:predicted outer membrane repeat protein
MIRQSLSARWIEAIAALLLVGGGATHAQSFCTPVSAEPSAGAVIIGNGTPGSVTTADIQNALAAGGTIRFNVGAAPTTVNLTSTLVASRATVLDGAGVVTLSGSGMRRILSIVNPNPAQNAPLFRVTLQNITLANAQIGDGRGAAIYKQHGAEFPHKVSLKLVNCRFTNNAAPLDGTSQDDGGGAFYGELLDRIDIGNCVFENNRGSNGGAVYSLGSLQVNIVDSQFLANQAIGAGGNPGNGGNAGALGIDGANRLVDICRTRFVDNTSNAFGAGFFSVMYDQTSRTRFEDTLFQGNRQLSNAQHTGGAYIQDGPWAIERTTFDRNEANGFGGLFIAGNAPGLIRNSTFSGNIARTGLGGAMALSNTATIDIVNTTIASNVATAAFAGGIAIGTPNQLRLTNVILANNSGGNRFVSWGINNAAQFDGGGNQQWPQIRPMGGGNEVPATASVQFADPLLSPLAYNGGSTPTIAIPQNSAARDGGVGGANIPSIDQRGYARVDPVDRGAFEFGAEGIVFLNSFE